jgi:hypothetical protein
MSLTSHRRCRATTRTCSGTVRSSRCVRPAMMLPRHGRNGWATISLAMLTAIRSTQGILTDQAKMEAWAKGRPRLGRPTSDLWAFALWFDPERALRLPTTALPIEMVYIQPASSRRSWISLGWFVWAAVLCRPKASLPSEAPILT